MRVRFNEWTLRGMLMVFVVKMKVLMDHHFMRVHMVMPFTE